MEKRKGCLGLGLTIGIVLGVGLCLVLGHILAFSARRGQFPFLFSFGHLAFLRPLYGGAFRCTIFQDGGHSYVHGVFLAVGQPSAGGAGKTAKTKNGMDPVRALCLLWPVGLLHWRQPVCAEAFGRVRYRRKSASIDRLPGLCLHLAQSRS